MTKTPLIVGSLVAAIVGALANITAGVITGLMVLGLLLITRKGEDVTLVLEDQRKQQMEEDMVDDFQLIPPPSENDPQQQVEEMRNHSKRVKKYDTTKFNQSQFDRIIEANNKRLENNEGLATTHPDYQSAQELADMLNDEFNMNKSRQSFGDVWNGRVARNELKAV